MNQDAVFWGAIITIVGSVIVLGFLVYKVLQLMNKDQNK